MAYSQDRSYDIPEATTSPDEKSVLAPEPEEEFVESEYVTEDLVLNMRNIWT